MFTLTEDQRKQEAHDYLEELKRKLWAIFMETEEDKKIRKILKKVNKNRKT